MKIVQITDRLSVAAQPEPGDFRGFAAQGYGAVVNVRPDGEEPGQMGSAAEKEAARKAGLSYGFVPVTGPTITEPDIRAFQRVLSAADGPTLVHCRSGTRALTLHALGEVLDGRMKRDDLAALGRRFGFDLSGAAAWLDREAARTPLVKGFHDSRTGSVQYVVTDPATKRCAIIDPVHDFDEKSGSTATTHADAILAYVAEQGLTVAWILDTHPHADHFSAADYLRKKTGARTATGAHVVDVQKLWKTIYDWPEFEADGSQWDRLFAEDDNFELGTLTGRVMHSPGHTLASVTYVIGDAAFVHDTVFMPDSGTARADFPGASAKALWNSIERILALPDETRLFTGHDYEPGGRHPKWESTVAEQKRSNAHVAGITKDRFIALREARDRTLPMPKLILHALQVNIRGGRLPEPDSKGRRYLRFPLDALPAAAW